MREEATAEGIHRFEAFFDAEHRRLYGTLCLVTGNGAEAEEIMQEAFLRMWERWGTVHTLDNPAAYLYRTAFNLSRNRFRRTVRAALRTLGAQPAVDAFAAVDEREDLIAALRALSPRMRAAVVLLDLMDFTSEEAGHLLAVRPATARGLAFQARQALRASMRREGVGDE